jgi:hypothetical protein
MSLSAGSEAVLKRESSQSQAHIKRKAKDGGRGRGILCTASLAIPWLQSPGGGSNPSGTRREPIFLIVALVSLGGVIFGKAIVRFVFG